MLPPTRVAIPSSPTHLLKDAVKDSPIDQKVSRIRVRFVLNPEAPRVFAKSLSCVSAAPRAFADKTYLLLA